MITIESMMSIDKSSLPEASKTVSTADIPQLVEWLSAKNDNIRYRAFLSSRLSPQNLRRGPGFVFI
jgi:hypothetical protein